ncbi:MAG: flagellar hook-basal body complex protein, partial [Gammaproteobacteria bacterium]|nr:flagellar hook-basal body complex protein [Gammaproteobacteria bacterium]
LIADIQDQLGGAGIAVDVREDPNNAGRLQFFSTDDGVASTVTIGNYQTTDANVSVSNIANLLRLADGATSSVPGPGAIGTTGSFTQSSFDVTIAGGSGPGGNATASILLNQNITSGDVNGLVTLINNQLASIPLPGIDVRAQEDPTNPGRIQFAATVAGETSAVTLNNFNVPAIAGDVQATAADIEALLGGVVSGTSDNTGVNTNATFQVTLTGSSVPSENQTVSVTLNSNVSTLQDLITDIRNDLVSTGIGINVREDPNSFGRLQFYAVTGGEASTITIDPNDNAQFGNGVSQIIVEAALGDIALGQAGSAGSSNTIPNPFGGTGVAAAVGNRSSASFDLTVAGASVNNGTITIVLSDNIQDVNDLITDIRDNLAPSGIGVDVREDPANAGRLQFFATVPGEASTIIISNLDASNIGVTQNDLTNTLNLATGVTVPGIPGVDNGYIAQSVDVVQADGSTQTVTTTAGGSAAQIAGQFSSTIVPGVTATASTTARIPFSSFINVSSNLQMSINGVALSGATLADIATTINNTPGLGTVSGSIDASGDLIVIDQVGNDLIFDVAGGFASDSIDVLGTQGAAITLTSAGISAAAIGGSVAFTLDEGVTMGNPSPASSNLFGLLGASAFTQFQLNTFDPNNQETYNAATSATIFDSLGNPHVMSLYFVKERFTPGVAGQEENRWTMYTLIDGQDVGDPDPNLAPPANSQPTRASYTVQFERDGSLNPAGTDPILVSNWVPLDTSGNQNGAVGPQNILSGGVLPIPDPSTSSNFEIRLGDSTQFGSGFALNRLDQNGYTSGELSGLSIDQEGLVSARFTNGQSLNLGQIAVADFENVQGLKAIGNTAWIQTNDSGEPTIGAPSSGSLGAVTSGALEDSNVELSEQLVQLLIAQRNFQANARTISTADEITQTIINL